MITGALRSLLFVPATEERKIEKALSLPCDAIILDLEDAVAESRKEAARHLAKAVIDQAGSEKPLFVRVNDWTTGLTPGDIETVAVPGLGGILLPMVESTVDIHRAEALLARAERQHDMAPSSLALAGLIETARGVLDVGVIAREGKRLNVLMPGAGDLCTSLGIPTANSGPHIDNAKIQTALASAAYGLWPPLDTPYFDIGNHAGFEAACRSALALGYQGKAVIHPAQIEIANRVFSPDEAEVAEAEEIVAGFARAEAQGVGAITVGGKLVDYAMAKAAERTLQRAKRVGMR